MSSISPEVISYPSQTFLARKTSASFLDLDDQDPRKKLTFPQDDGAHIGSTTFFRSVLDNFEGYAVPPAFLLVDGKVPVGYRVGHTSRRRRAR